MTFIETVQARKDIFSETFRLDLSIIDHHDPVRHADDLLLVGDHDQTLFFLFVYLLQFMDQHRKALEVDPCFRLIKNT